MSKVTVLGGAGVVGSVAVRTLASGEFFDEVVIAENRVENAWGLARELDTEVVSVTEVDAADPDSLKRAIAGSTVVVNCIGPFYRFGPPVLKAVISSGIDYVDVCDDLEPTERMLAMDAEARAAGVRALIGMGNSPGLANVIARWCSEAMLSQVHSVDIYHAHGGEPDEGAAVVKHRIHAMTSDIPLFTDGKFVKVRMLEESGRRFATEVDFKGLGTYPVFPYPHPETITMPRHLEGIRRVTNMGVVIPLEYFRLTMDMVRLGVFSEDPIDVQGDHVIPLEFAVAYIMSRRGGMLKKAGLDEPTGCLKVVVAGELDGEPHTYSFYMYSKGAGAGEGTGIPVALGAILMRLGKVEGEGVFPPEVGVRPADVLELGGRVVKGTGMADELPISIEHAGPDGSIEDIKLKI